MKLQFGGLTAGLLLALSVLGGGVVGSGDATAAAQGKTTVEKMRTGTTKHKEFYVEVEKRLGVRQPFLFIRPQEAAAAVVLLPGGDGVVEISTAGVGKSGNFVVRSRNLFADQGLAVAVVDVPSDRKNLGDGFRISLEHAHDLKGVIAFLKKRTGLPVWVVGTSRGTVSASNAASRLQEGGADGVVLTSAVFKSSKSGKPSLYDTNPGDVRAPVLMAHHRDDGCYVTRFRDLPPALAAFTNAPLRETLVFEGGAPPRSPPCKGKSQHGFLGIEEKVVKAIAGWIKAHPPK